MRLYSAALVIVFIVGCSNGSSPDDVVVVDDVEQVAELIGVDQFNGTSWNLDSIQLNTGETWVVRDLDIPFPHGIEFITDDMNQEQLSGNLDCNGFSVPYAVSASTITFDIAEITDGQCEQTTDIVGIVGNFFVTQMVLTIQIETDRLIFLSGTNEALIYTPQ